MTEENAKDIQNDSVPFYPDHVTTELKVIVWITTGVMVLGVLGLIFPLGLGDPADPMNTPEHVKPEWYFLALYQVLKFIPKTTGVVAPILAIALLTIWPFLDRKPETTPKMRRVRFWVVIAALIIFFALTIWGEVS